MSTNYPAKYWWIVLVVVPIITASIPGLLNFLKGNSRTTPIKISGFRTENNMKIVSAEVIINEVEYITSDKNSIKALKKEVENAIDLVKNNLYKEAILRFEEVAQKAGTAAVYNNLGVLQAATDQIRKAEKTFQKAIALSPQLDELRENAAAVYEHEGKLDEAIRQLEKASRSKRVNARLKRLHSLADSLVRNSLTFSIGESDGFGGMQGGKRNPGDRYAINPNHPRLQPGDYLDYAGLDKETIYGLFRFTFNIPIDTKDFVRVTSAQLFIQSGSLAKTTYRGFGNAQVIVNGTNIGEFWPENTSQKGSDLEEIVKLHEFDITRFVPEGVAGTVNIVLDGKSPKDDSGYKPLAGEDIFAIDFVKVIVEGWQSKN